MKLIFKWSPRNKQFVSHNEVRVYFHDTLVDLHIPGAAMRAANLVLVRGSLTSRVSILHTQHTYRLNTWMHTWNGFVPFANQANEHTHSINCAWYPVFVCVSHHKNLFFLASLLLFLSWLWIFPSSRLPELSPIWKFYFHFQFYHHLPAFPCPCFLIN